MPFLYILQSEKDNKLYVGTCNVLEKRLEMHDKGRVKSTKYRRSLVLKYAKEFVTLSEARKEEWKLKNTLKGGRLKKELVSKAAGSSNGRTSPSGGDYLGTPAHQYVLLI